jgi:hypothetical protein
MIVQSLTFLLREDILVSVQDCLIRKLYSVRIYIREPELILVRE